MIYSSAKMQSKYTPAHPGCFAASVCGSDEILYDIIMDTAVAVSVFLISNIHNTRMWHKP